MRLNILLPSLIGLTLSAHLPLNAAIVYVATSGQDSSTFGTTSPCQTIHYAISDRAASGDTVAVGAGTFAEHLSISIPLKLLGSGATKTFIDGSSKGIVVTIGSNVTLAKLTVQHGATFSCRAGVVNNPTAILFRVTVTGNNANGGDIGSGMVAAFATTAG